VADYWNNRIQLFRTGQLNGSTIAGSGSSGTIALNNPTDVVLDFDGYLFITDSGNNRIVGSGPSGYYCIVGCTGSSGTASNQLNHPQSLSFDNNGNLFVVDCVNNRIQKFFLATNSCGKIESYLVRKVI
jgi:sugar lactone lactonase YvrE